MRVGDKLRVIDNQPASGQSNIRRLIGNVYEIAHVWRENRRETGEVSISIECGEIILNPDEYELVKS